MPSTPSGNSHTRSANSDLQTSSSKKKRRRRGGSKRFGDSGSEVTTTISEDVAPSVDSPIQKRPEVLVPASQISLSQLPPNASAEEIRVFENEPEIFGVYASSDGEENEERERPVILPPHQKRLEAYSPSNATGPAESSPVRDLREESVQSLQAEPANPQIGSDVPSSGVAQILNPKKLPNGKFECPFKAEYDCTKTFARADGAKRHASTHISIDQFKCEQCDKTFSRKDKLASHIKTHGQQNGTEKQVGSAQAKAANGPKVNGVADTKKFKDGETAANVPNGNLSGSEETDDEPVMQTENGNPTEDDSATSEREAVDSETDEGEEVNTIVDTQNRNGQGTDNGRGEVAGERSTARSNVGNILSTPTEKTIISSPKRAPSPAEIQQSPVVNGRNKRKRPSPRASPEFEALPAQKRVRQDRNTDLRPSSSQPTDARKKKMDASATRNSDSAENGLSRDSNVEMHSQGSRGQKRLSKGQEIVESDHEASSSTDVEMEEVEHIQESDHESASKSDEGIARTPAPVTEKVMIAKAGFDANTRMNDGSPDSSSEEAEEDKIEEQEEDENDSDVEAEYRSHRSGTKASDAPSSPLRRQSSMDNFVQRSQSATTSTRASSSRSRVSVNIPTRSKPQSKQTQSKLQLQEQAAANESAQGATTAATAYTSGDEQSQGGIPRTDAGGRSQPLNKGKGKARAKDANDIEEKTSSEDRPRATTVARRTSSHSSKSRPQLKSRTVPKKRTKPTSDSDESEDAEKPKPKAKRPSKKKAKVAAEEASEEKDKVKRKRSVSTAKTTWAEASKSGVTGKFTEDEIQTLNAWRDSFCKENNLTAYEFNEMMQNTASVSKLDWRYGWITKADFMQQYYEQLPDRNRRSMIRFRERNFVNADKTPWTDEHDNELRQLVAEHGTKWVEIAQIMGRTQDAIHQRWRHKLNYGEKPALMGEWTTEEVQKLEDEVTAFARMKHTTPDDEELQIPWVAISKKMGNGRTAQQCSNRWRINTSRRVNGKFVKVPHNDRLPGTKVKQPRTPSKMEKRLSGHGQSSQKSDKVYKSSERVEDSEGEAEEGGDADDESNDVQEDKESEVDDERDDLDNDEEEPDAASEDEQKHNNQQPEDNSADKSKEDQTASEPEQEPSSSKDVQKSAANKHTAQLRGTSPSTTKYPAPKTRNLPQTLSSSQPLPKTTNNSSPSQPALLPSSQPAPLKTPATSKNPLKRVNRTRSSPDDDLSLTQLYAGTQANSSAKRTTGRTNRTRVPDSAVTEDRPSPGLSLRRRPVRSSSPLLSPLVDGSGNVGVDGVDGDSEGGTSGDSDDDSGNDDGDMDVDLKSPTSFVSARDVAGSSTSDSDSDSDDDDEDDEQDNTQTKSGSGSDSDSSSSSDSTSPEPTPQPTFWQSVNQGVARLTGLGRSQSQSQGGSQSQSQSRSQDQSQTRKGRFSLTDALRSGVMEEGDDDSDDDD